MTGARAALVWILAACLLGLVGSRPAETAELGLLYDDPPPPMTAPTPSEPAVRHGSVLIYNLVTSSAADPTAENTRLTLTNRNETQTAAVRLFFVEGASGSATSSVACLHPGQTASVLASSLRAGVTGFVVAIAVHPTTGCPIVFNDLAGQGQVWLASQFRGILPALGVAAVSAPSCDSAPQVTVFFDGVAYSRLPRVLHLTNLASRADERTLLVVNRIGGTGTTFNSPIGTLTGTLYDDAQHAFGYSASTGTRRQFLSELSDAFPSTAPPLGTVIPAGRTGWLRIFSQSDIGLTGAAFFLKFQPQAAPSAARSATAQKPKGVAGTRQPPAAIADFTGALDLRISTLSSANSYTFTPQPPGC